MRSSTLSSRTDPAGAELAPEQLLALPSLWRRVVRLVLVAFAAWPSTVVLQAWIFSSVTCGIAPMSA